MGRRHKVFTHIREHVRIYILIIIVMVIGLVKGSIDLVKVEEVTILNLGECIKDFFDIGSARIENDIFFREFRTMAKLFLVVWISGSSLIGFPIIAYIIYLKGYALGFLSGVLIKSMGIRGTIVMVMAVLPKEMFLIPIIVVLGVMSMQYSLYMINNRRIFYSKSVIREFVKYALKGGACSLLGTLVVAINTKLLINGWYNNLINCICKIVQ
ncbi:MAG: stage II sporulation protein M [Clostridiales bacterium]|nr:stage II sporulation protein M [Clostridiales bacterium]